MTQLAPLAPGSTIGILGGGQLGRMLAQAASKLGFHTHIYCPDEKSPAADVANHWTKADYVDEAALKAFVAATDIITYEFENIPTACIDIIEAADGMVHPGKKALQLTQDRLTEKRFLKGIEIETAPFMPIASDEALGMAMRVTGLPAIMKTRRFGYDGKGQTVIHDEDEGIQAWAEMNDTPTILEGFVGFEKEISVIIAKGSEGHVTFPPAENVHKDGILRASTVPANINDDVRAEAERITIQIAKALEYVGVLAVEFFVEPSGLLRVNEIAPRVHNSGHWTVEACQISQFEAHIRAITNWPLPSVNRHSDAIMENLIGEDAANWPAISGEENTSLTLYGKKEMRGGRKMGHVTRLKKRDG